MLSRDELGLLVRRYGPLVYRRARVLLGDHHDAEEAVQEVFLRAMQNAEAFEKRSQLSTWLYGITTNYCLNLIRDRTRRRELREQHLQPVPGIILDGRDPEELILMRQLLAEAEERSARAAVYVILDGMSHEEASHLLGLSRRTVGNLVEQFKVWARDYLEKKSIRRPL